MKKFFVSAVVFTAMFLMVSCGGSDSNSITYPWTDPDTKLTWSSLSSDQLTWYEADSYCSNLYEGGFADWHLPTIDELRTLIQNCYKTVTNGSCQISETNNCLSTECFHESHACTCSTDLDYSGLYSKLGDSHWIWSSSILGKLDIDSNDYAWGVGFYSGEITANIMTKREGFIRCVR